jgi:hypothetical protein
LIIYKEYTFTSLAHFSALKNKQNNYQNSSLFVKF